MKKPSFKETVDGDMYILVDRSDFRATSLILEFLTDYHFVKVGIKFYAGCFRFQFNHSLKPIYDSLLDYIILNSPENYGT